MNAGKEDITEFISTNWPKGNSDKVPSEISYSPADNRESQWGYDMSSGALKLVWTKLELDQQERPDELRMILKALRGMKNLDKRYIEESNGLPSYPSKDSVDIVAEYLSKVREYVIDHPPAKFKEAYSAYVSTLPIDLVVTVPAVRMRQSIKHSILGSY